MKNSLLLALLGVSLSLMACKKESACHYETKKDCSDRSSMPGLAAQTAQFAQPTWETPRQWEALPLDNMRKGSWRVVDGDKAVDISVLAFPGDVGGDLANVNRWAQQIGMREMDAVGLDDISNEIDVAGIDSRWVTLEETETSKAIVAAIVPRETGTWFFKMMGDRDLVLSQQAPFRSFLRTVEFQ